MIAQNSPFVNNKALIMAKIWTKMMYEDIINTLF